MFKECEWEMPNVFNSLRREIDALAMWMIFLTWIFQFKLEEIMTANSFEMDTNISQGRGFRKRGKNLRKYTSIIVDL